MTRRTKALRGAADKESALHGALARHRCSLRPLPDRPGALAAGPDFKRGKVVQKEIRTIDICPTVFSLFSRKALPHSNARVIKELFA